MMKRLVLVTAVAGLALGTQLAHADPQWFYPGHGWLPQPPLTETAPDSAIRLAGQIPAPSESEENARETPARFCEPAGSTESNRPLEDCGY